MRMQWFLRRRLVYTVLAVFLFETVSPDFVQAQQRIEPPNILAQAVTPGYESEKAMLDRSLASIEATRETIDRTNFDPAARAMAVGARIEDLFFFVRDQISYHPYRGRLRFAQGTLMSHAGNSCDKSDLLATMLRHHGHKVRFARAQLDDGIARALVLSSDMPPSAESHKLGQELRRVTIDLLKRTGLSSNEIDEVANEHDKQFNSFFEALVRGSDYNVDELTFALKRAGIDFTGKNSTDAATLLEAAKDHCWVQVETQGKWVDLDASAYRIKLGERLAEPTATSDMLPLDLAYALHFVVTIEKVEDSKVERFVVLDHAAPLLDALSRIQLGFRPENAARDNVIGFVDTASLAKFAVAWPVLIINDKAVVGDPFDLSGRKLARDPRERALAGFSSALGGRTNSELRQVTLALSIKGPGGFTKGVVRELARRAPGPKDVVELNLRRQLLGSLELVTSGSRIDETFYSGAMLDRVSAARPLLEHLLKVDHALAKPEQLDFKLLSGLSHTDEAFEYLYLRSNLLDARLHIADATIIAFAGEPQVVAYRRKVMPAADSKPRLIEGYDVIANALHVYDDPFRMKDAVATSASFRFEQGVIDTLLEYLLMRDGNAVNAHSVTVSARNRDGDNALKLIRPNEVLEVDRLQASAADKAALRRDLERGFAVAVPEKPVVIDGQSHQAWWRVHPENGETLGIGADGEGQSALEALMLEALFGASGSLTCAILMEEFEGLKFCLAFILDITVTMMAATLLSRVVWPRFVSARQAAAAARQARASTLPLPSAARPPTGLRPLGRGGVVRGPGPRWVPPARGMFPRPLNPPRTSPGDTTIIDKIFPWIVR